MSRLKERWLMACSTLLVAAVGFAEPARGEFSMLAGEFDGGEAKRPGYSCEGIVAGELYQTVDFSVSAGGDYIFFSAYSSFDWWDGDYPGSGLDVEMYIFDGSVDPVTDFDRYLYWLGDSFKTPKVTLQAGTAYTLLLSQPCYLASRESGSWTVVANGAGAVQSGARREIPPFSTGQFSANAPNARGRCGEKLQNLNIAYQQMGPFKVSKSGRYYFSDARMVEAANTCQAIYSAPFNPDNVEANLVGSDYSKGYTGLQHLGQWELDLAAGTDYWLVVQPKWGATAVGDYFFVMAPPKSFRINPGLTGLWADLGTPGQGMYLDVFNRIDAVFMAWFTYELQRPGPEAHAVLGDPGHRWLTGLGGIAGSGSEIEVVWTTGGQFDSASPQLTRHASGQVRLEFDSCTSGRALYEFPELSLSGVVQLRRPFEDAQGIAKCEKFQQGPGIPGPL